MNRWDNLDITHKSWRYEGRGALTRIAKVVKSPMSNAKCAIRRESVIDIDSFITLKEDGSDDTTQYQNGIGNAFLHQCKLYWYE